MEDAREAEAIEIGVYPAVGLETNHHQRHRFADIDAELFGKTAADHDLAVALRGVAGDERLPRLNERSEEHTSELQSLMRISYAVFCLKKKKKNKTHDTLKRLVTK